MKKCAAIIIEVDDSNTETARTIIEQLIKDAQQSGIFTDVFIDDKYADPEDSLSI